MQTEQISALNEVMAIIDTKASRYKEQVFHLTPAQRFAEKKILLDIIQNGLDIANSIKPPPPEISDVIFDLTKLAKQLKDMV